MKIQRIQIHNIASIERASIDFCRGPLAEERLFLICGETGAGKTTILNSICLALYNSTPALLAYGSNDKDANGQTTRNSSQMLRRGAKDGCVMLDFEGNDGVEYAANWTARRVRTRDQRVKIEVKTWIDRRKDGVRTETPVSELTGLTFKQFTQTTILAQGQFTKFLLADEGEKAEILEKLTGTEAYAAIGKSIFDTMRAKEEELKSLNDRIAGAKLLSDDEKTALKDELPALNGTIIRCAKQLNEIDAKLKWIAECETADKRLDENAKRRQLAEQAKQAPEYLSNCRAAEIWESTAEVRQLMADEAQEKKNLDEHLRARPRLAERYGQILGGIEWLKSEKATLGQKLAELDASVKRRADRAPMFAKAHGIELLANSAIAERDALLDSKKHLIDLSKDISKEETSQKNATSQEQAAKEKYAASAKIADELEKEAKKYDLKAISDVVEKLRDRSASLQKAGIAIGYYQTSKGARIKAEKDAQDAEAEAMAAMKEIDGLEANMPALKSDHQAKKALLDGMMELKDHIQSLRRRFAETRECPLCGSKDVEIATDELIDDKVSDAKEAEEKAKSAVDDAMSTLSRSKTSLKALEKNLKKKREEASDAFDEEAKAMDEAKKAIGGMDLDYEDEAFERVIASKEAALSEEKAARSKELQAALDANNAFEEARLAMESDRKAKEKAEKAKEAIELKLAELRVKVDGEKAIAEKSRTTMDDALRQINEMLVDEESATIDNVKAITAGVTARAVEYEADKQRLSEGKATLKDLEMRITQAEASSAPLSKAFDGTVAAEPKEIKDLQSLIADLTVKASVVEERILCFQAAIEAKAKEIAEYFAVSGNCAKEEAKEAAGYTAADISQFKEKIKVVDEELVAANAAYAEISKQKEEILKRRPEMEEGLTSQALQEEHEKANAQREEASNRLATVKTLLKDNDERDEVLKETKAQRDALTEICANWSRLEDLYGGAKGQKFRLMAQCYVLRTLLHKANHYLEMLSPRYELYCVDNSLVINVIDHDQNDSIRPVTLLSGGESFIVSLALALGLSAISKERLHVDTLFIDEGFGSLDAETLEMVMSTLNRLHRIGGRRVGIISHVSSLAERIPAQIRMRRLGQGKSTVDIVTL